MDRYQDTPSPKISFISSHVGGDLNDTQTEFVDQVKLIENNTNDYNRLINYKSKLERDKNENDDFIQILDAKRHLTTYRINNAPTTVSDINYSNPIIFPDKYDPYFEYLESKNLGSINTQIIKTKTIVNIDSSLRNIKTFLKASNFYILEPNSLQFTNNSNILTINYYNSINYFKVNDKISLRGLLNYTIEYKSLKFFFENGSSTVVLDLKPNYDFEVAYYDIIIQINNVTNNGSNYYKNIPLTLINQNQIIKTVDYNSDIRMTFELPMVFYTQNDLDQTLISDCTIIYNNLGNYPINLINAFYPLSYTNLIGYFIVQNVYQNYFTVKLNDYISINQNIILKGQWINSYFYTGSLIEIGIISSINLGDQNSNSYTVYLNKVINNVAQMRILSSEIPNIQNNIYKFITNVNFNIISSNNKFYWENLLDTSLYSIEIPVGFYTLTQLQVVIENLVNNTPRKLINSNNNLYPFNNISIELDTSADIISFTSINTYILPNCFFGLAKDNNNVNTNGNEFLLKINHAQHNLNVGDLIIIKNSIDYYNIPASYINNPNGYKIINIINNDFYTIKLTDINLLIKDAGNTYGGLSINIITKNSFRLRFDFSDAIGSLIGFKQIGSPYSITNYCGLYNDYTITNIQPYYINIEKQVSSKNATILSNNQNKFNTYGFSYMLLKCENFNLCTNPNGESYFYKFLLNGNVGSILYNSYVDAPIYLNPPIKSISSLSFNFIDPTGNLINFNNVNNSFTLEITSFSNCPPNTNINHNLARI